MTMDLSGWRVTPATDREPTSTGRRPFGRTAFAAFRTVGLLVIAMLAILVLLPALIAAQPTVLG